MRIKHFIFALALVLMWRGFGIRAVHAAEAPTSQPSAATDENMNRWWVDLAKQEPDSSRALLHFSAVPEQTVAFLKDKMKPLTISEAEVKTLLAKLGSDDEATATAAFNELEYFDPRLAIDIEILMKEVTETPVRQRLVAVLSGQSIDSLEGKDIILRSEGTKGSGDFNFYSKPSSWWAEGKVSRLNAWNDSKPKWTRAVRAITLLQFIGTPDAMAIVKQMATGHPDAQPTRAAKAALTGP